jgi:hypothetical protein
VSIPKDTKGLTAGDVICHVCSKPMVLMQTEVPGRAGPLRGWICQFKHDEPSTEATFDARAWLVKEQRNVAIQFAAKVQRCIEALDSKDAEIERLRDDRERLLEARHYLMGVNSKSVTGASIRDAVLEIIGEHDG